MQRSLAYLREQGYTAEIVERRVPGCNVTQDFFGFADILAVHPAYTGVLAIQTTTRAHQASRRKKVRESDHFSTWIETGNRVHVHGWAKIGRRGERKTWQVTIWEA